MTFLKSLSETFRREAKKYKTLFLPEHRVDVNYDAKPIREGEAYCRLWLVEMRLARDVDWFKTWYPVVHAAIGFNYGKQAVTVPYLAGPDALKDFTQENLDRIIQCNYPMTPLFPFNEGLVELEVGLFSMVASDSIGRLITAMEKISKVVPVPELASALDLADVVYSAFEDLLSAGDGRLELGYRQTFTAADGGGSKFLRPGYFVAILVDESKIDDDTLCIVNDSLRIGIPGRNKEFLHHKHQPLQGYNYILFRIEKRMTKDWESLTSIQELVYKAQDAILDRKPKQAQEILSAIKVAVFRNAYLTKPDRFIMYIKIEDYLREFGLQAIGQQLPRLSLYPIMKRSSPVLNIDQETDLSTLEKLFNP